MLVVARAGFVKQAVLGFGLAVGVLAWVKPVRAGLTIVPTFGSSITSLSNAATIESSIDATIARIDAEIANPITVNIYFQDTNSGLGGSTTGIYRTSYVFYHSLLENNQNLSANDMKALQSLPSNSDPNYGAAQVIVTSSDFRALGISADGGISEPGSSTDFDGAVSLNLSIMNLSRTGPQNSSDYDLQSVVGHEIDEVLGIGGTGSDVGGDGALGVLDLFRYSAPGVRSDTTSTSAKAYFSVDGGVTNLVSFNQTGGGTDYGDWGNPNNPGHGNTPAQLQDAFEDRGTQANLGTNELTALDVIGYDIAVPEPSSSALLLAGSAMLLGVRRRRTA